MFLLTFPILIMLSGQPFKTVDSRRAIAYICRELYSLQCTFSLIVSLALTFDVEYHRIQRKRLTLSFNFVSSWPYDLGKISFPYRPLVFPSVIGKYCTGVPRLPEIVNDRN